MVWNIFIWKGPTSPTALAPRDWTVRGIAQISFKCNKLGASATSLGSLFECLTNFSAKKLFLKSSPKLPWCCFEPFPCGLSLHFRKKSSVIFSSLLLLRKLQRAVRPHLSLFLSKLHQPKILSCPSTGHAFQPFLQLCSSPLDIFEYFNILFELWGPGWLCSDYCILIMSIMSLNWISLPAPVIRVKGYEY